MKHLPPKRLAQNCIRQLPEIILRLRRNTCPAKGGMIIRANTNAAIIDNLPREGASNANAVFNEFGANAASSIGEDAFPLVAFDAVRPIASIPRSAASAFLCANGIYRRRNRAGDCSVNGAVSYKRGVDTHRDIGRIRKLRWVAKYLCATSDGTIF